MTDWSDLISAMGPEPTLDPISQCGYEFKICLDRSPNVPLESSSRPRGLARTIPLAVCRALMVALPHLSNKRLALGSRQP